MVAANSINESSPGITGFSGTEFVGNGIAQYSVLVAGTPSEILSSAAPGTSGFPLISQGASSNPVFALLPMDGGGTGALLTPQDGGIFYSNATTGAILAPTATAGKVLQSGSSTAPSWSAPTYPSSSGLAGKILRSDGSNIVYTTATFSDSYTSNNVLYSSGGNIVGLATANNGVLITSSGGVPSISSTIPSATQDNITRLGTVTSGTWSATAVAATVGGTGQTGYAVGDILYASTTTVISKLADVATGNALISGGVNTAPSWGKIGLTTHVSGTLGVTNGGTGLSSTTANQILYSSATSTIAGLATANNGVLITSSGGVPSISSTLPSAVQSNITAVGTITSTVVLRPTASNSVYQFDYLSSGSLASNKVVRMGITGSTNGFTMEQDAGSVIQYLFASGNVTMEGNTSIGTNSSSTLNLNVVTSATANTGAVTAPAQVVGYLQIVVNGTTRKIPYYAN